MLTESYEYVQFRTSDSLTKVKEKTRLARAYGLQLDTRLEDIRKDAQATDIEVLTAVNHMELMVEHQKAQQLARLQKLNGIQAVAETERLECTRAKQVEKKKTLSRSKLQKRLARARKLLEGQRAERKVMWMCYGVLHMSKAKLEGKLVRLETAFGTRDEEIVADKYNQALFQEQMYRTDIEEKLSQLAKLQTAYLELSKEFEEVQRTSPRVKMQLTFQQSLTLENRRRLHQLEDKVLKDSGSLLAWQIDVSVHITSIIALLKKIKSADPYQRLMTFPPELLAQLAVNEVNPSLVTQTLLILEKALVTAIEIPTQRLSRRKKVNPVNNTVKLMIENTLNRRRNTIIELKSKELFGNHFLTKDRSDSPHKKMSVAEDLLKNVASLEAMASSHVKNSKSLAEELLSVNTEPAEFHLAEIDRKNYKNRLNLRLKMQDIVQPIIRDSSPSGEKNTPTTEMFASRDLFEIDKKRRALKSYRRGEEVNLKTETADFFLNIKRDR